MNFRGPERSQEPEINLIPMIDLLLVIVIFLAVSTTYARLSELQVSLPEAARDAPARRGAEVVVVISREGRYLIGSAPVAFENTAAFAGRLRDAAGADPGATLVIQADARAPHQNVVHVLEAARLAGLARIGFATQSASGGR